MPRGYRSIILAAVGWLILGASPEGQRTNANSAQTQREIANTLREISSSLKEANKPDELESECAPEKPNRKSDLCAQWQAADAAVASAQWTQATFWLGVGGLVVGIATFGAAFAAAWFAKKASDHTEAGVIEARNAAVAAQNNLEAFLESERALIRIEGILIRHQKPDPVKSIMFHVKNYGRGIGTILKINYTLGEIPAFPVNELFETEINSIIGTEGGNITWITNPNKSISPVIITGYFEYISTLGRSYRTHFCFEIPKGSYSDPVGSQASTPLIKWGGLPPDT